jgi:tetratricopeptide (TPR) repeat protein
VLYLQHRGDEAHTAFRRALELNPESALLHGSFGTILRDEGQHEDAITEYRRATALDPGQAVFHALLGTLLSEQPDSDALVEFRRALELDPDLAGSLYSAASSLMEQASQGWWADKSDANLIDACWLLVTANHLAPANLDYSRAMRRVGEKLGDRQHCPPD